MDGSAMEGSARHMSLAAMEDPTASWELSVWPNMERLLPNEDAEPEPFEMLSASWAAELRADGISLAHAGMREDAAEIRRLRWAMRTWQGEHEVLRAALPVLQRSARRLLDARSERRAAAARTLGRAARRFLGRVRTWPSRSACRLELESMALRLAAAERAVAQARVASRRAEAARGIAERAAAAEAAERAAREMAFDAELVAERELRRQAEELASSLAIQKEAAEDSASRLLAEKLERGDAGETPHECSSACGSASALWSPEHGHPGRAAATTRATSWGDATSSSWPPPSSEPSLPVAMERP